MNLPALKNELVGDPLLRDYAGMADHQARANSLNALNRMRLRTQLSSAQVYESIGVAEFQALDDAQKAFVRDVLGLGEGIDVQPGSKARTVLIAVFGAESTTILNLAEALQETISRAQELGLGFATVGDIEKAYAHPAS